MDIESCPKCMRPRAIGHRCPSCGQAATVVDQQPAAPGDVGTWRTEAASWQATPGPAGHSGRSPAGPTQRSSGGKSKKGLLATAIVAVVVIAVVAVVAVMLTTGGAAVVQEEAAVASAPEKATDQAAQSLLRNAMMAIDAVAVESGDYKAVTQATLKTMEPAIAWQQGKTRTCISPPAGAKAQQNAVAWICTGQLTYELGAWSASGVAFGVRVDKAGGGTTYYKNGEAATW
jgi:hypothetical protein